ncbi:hypothetical protein B566_EDAN004643 [Ephemera danica]|nr:hypothetical protein B566_EDAN004643 [Ephemera danica]
MVDAGFNVRHPVLANEQYLDCGSFVMAFSFTTEELDYYNQNAFHPSNCDESPASLEEMRRKLQKEPESVHWSFKGMSSAPVEAILVGHSQCLQLILEAGADIKKLSEGHDLLHYAYMSVHENRVDCIKILNLLGKYGYPFSADSDGQLKSPFQLLLAIRSNYPDVLQCLLENGAVPESMSISDTGKKSVVLMIPDLTPLTLAVRYRNMNCYRLLMLYNACHKVYNHADLFNKRYVEFPIPIYLINTYASIPLNHGCTLKEILQQFIDFGGNLWAKATKRLPGYAWNLPHICEPGQTALDYLQTNPNLLSLLPEGVETEIQQLMQTPMTLKQIGRLAVRQCMGKNYVRNIKHLEVPAELKIYLQFL